MKKNYRYIILLINMFISQIAFSQNYRDDIIESIQNISQEKLIDCFLETGWGYSGCFPVNVKSDNFRGKCIIESEELLYFYESEILDSLQRENFSMDKYYEFAKNLLIFGDTVRLKGDLCDEKKDWKFTPVSHIDSIENYPEEEKQILINSIFREDASLKKPTDSDYRNYNLPALIAKLFEWNIFIVYLSEEVNFSLFDYRAICNIDQMESILNACLFDFIDYINNPLDLYVSVTDYPQNISIYKDILNEKGVKCINLQDMALINKDILGKNIRVINFSGIKLIDNQLQFIFSENLYTCKKKNRISSKKIQWSEFIYLYSQDKDKWLLSKINYHKEE